MKNLNTQSVIQSFWRFKEFLNDSTTLCFCTSVRHRRWFPHTVDICFGLFYDCNLGGGDFFSFLQYKRFTAAELSALGERDIYAVLSCGAPVSQRAGGGVGGGGGAAGFQLQRWDNSSRRGPISSQHEGGSEVSVQRQAPAGSRIFLHILSQLPIFTSIFRASLCIEGFVTHLANV